MAFTRRCTIEIQSGQITGTLTGIAVSIQIANNDLKLIAGGGYSTDANGFGVRVFSDAALTATVPFYLLYYNGTSGTFIADALPASATVGDKLYLGIGDASLTTNASSTSTYSSGTGYALVLPFVDGTTLSTSDISGNSRNATNVGATAGSGAIGSGAASFNGSNNYLSIPHFNVTGSTIAISAILNTNINNAIKEIAASRAGMTGAPGGTEDWLLAMDANGKIVFNVNTSGSGSTFNNSTLVGATVLSTGTSYVVHGTYDGTNAKIYLNGVQDATAAWSGSVYASGSSPIHIGDDGSVGRFWNGTQQFFRMQTSRTAAWIDAESRMWRTPATFASYTFDAAPATSAARTSVIICG